MARETKQARRERILNQLLVLAENNSIDPESNHYGADMALCELINDDEIKQAFLAIDRWYA